MPVTRIVVPVNHELHPHVVVKKGSIPPYRLPPMLPDTVWHRRIRGVFYVLAMAYLLFIVGLWVRMGIHMGRPLIFGGMLSSIVMMPAIYYGIRPGKTKMWLITLGILLALVLAGSVSQSLFFTRWHVLGTLLGLIPIVLFLVPLILLGWQGIRAFRNR